MKTYYYEGKSEVFEISEACALELIAKGGDSSFEIRETPKAVLLCPKV